MLRWRSETKYDTGESHTTCNLYLVLWKYIYELGEGSGDNDLIEFDQIPSILRCAQFSSTVESG